VWAGVATDDHQPNHDYSDQHDDPYVKSCVKGLVAALKVSFRMDV